MAALTSTSRLDVAALSRTPARRRAVMPVAPPRSAVVAAAGLVKMSDVSVAPPLGRGASGAPVVVTAEAAASMITRHQNIVK